MERTIYANQDSIALYYAEETDRRLIYDMAFEEEDIWRSMFQTKGDFAWSEIQQEAPHFFGSTPGPSKYLLIEYDHQIIGTISHTFNDGKIPNMELDMWLRSTRYTGKGIGPSAMMLLIEHLTGEYSMNTFLIRPWVKNPRAIKAYEKCGFVPVKSFELSEYYGRNLDVWGRGDYQEGECVNMVLATE